MADFIEVSSKKEAQRLAYQHYQDKGSLTGGTKYILPDGTKLRVRKRISNVSGASDLKVEGFETKTKADVGRSTRIGSSRKEINRAIRNEAAAQWDELVGDRNATINIGGKPYSFDKYLNKEVRDHSKLTRQKAVESVNLGKSLGHGTPTTDVGRYAESYTQQFAETPSGNYSTQDYIPPDQLKRLQKAGLATSPQEAARLHVGTTKIGGRLPDPEIEKTLKINLGDKPVQARQLMPKGVTRNPLMRGAKAISRAIPGPADALLPGVVGGGLALLSGATLPQAAEAFGAGVVDGLTGDLDAGTLGSDQAVIIDGQQRFINRRNELMDKPGYGLEQSGGQWREVKRGTGVASQQERQALRSTAQQAANLIPKVNRAINPVGAGIMDFFAKPIGSAFNSIFGKREI
jgi:hypothetical protein